MAGSWQNGDFRNRVRSWCDPWIVVFSARNAPFFIGSKKEWKSEHASSTRFAVVLLNVVLVCSFFSLLFPIFGFLFANFCYLVLFLSKYYVRDAKYLLLWQCQFLKQGKCVILSSNASYGSTWADQIFFFFSKFPKNTQKDASFCSKNKHLPTGLATRSCIA